MGLFGSLFSAATKVVLTPVAMLDDASSTLDGTKGKSLTGHTLGSAVKDVGQGVEDLFNLDL